MKNAIERRLLVIEEDWSSIAQNPETRVVKWEASVEDLRMAELFFEIQNEETSTLPDLFLTFSVGFYSLETFGDELAIAIRDEYQICAETLVEEGIAHWEPDPLFTASPENQFRNFVETLHSFCNQFDSMFERLALVLTPDEISDPIAFESWLREIPKLALPTSVILVVLQSTEASAWFEISEGDQPSLKSISLNLDMPAAAEELAKREGQEGPGKDFRLQFLAIGNAGKAINPKAARRAARCARDIARKEGWLDQEVVVHLSLGSALLAANEPEAACKVYSKASEISLLLVEQEHPGGDALALTSQMSEGAALFAAQDFEQAAIVYRKAGNFAQRTQDLPASIDAWRMASYCYWQTAEAERAWECGTIALELGAEMEPADREATTLSYAGEMLVYFCNASPVFSSRSRDIQATMNSLLGEKWRVLTEADTT